MADETSTEIKPTVLAEAEPSSALEDVRVAYAPFRATHPRSVIVEADLDGPTIFVGRPWNDQSLVLIISDDNPGLRDALNNVLLPERFTAIWHKDTKDFEVIWTAYPLSSLWSEIPGRAFDFRFGGKKYACTFDKSSDRLLAIAKSFRPLTASSTQFRNLEPYKTHMTLAERHAADPANVPAPFTAPRSFWIRGVEWDENAVIALVNNLNFYLTYFDTISPWMYVHSIGEPAEIKPLTRYPSGAFPKNIDARPVDEVLIQLWMASRQGDEATRFLYSFRILEYAAFSYLDGKARLEIRRLLAAPDALDDIGTVTERVVDAIQKSDLDDFPKCEALLEATVKPERLWREINNNLEAFTKPIKFDGGFELKPLVADGLNEAQFGLKGIQNFHRAIREIRNALAHGKDMKSAGVISPTVRNYERLRPWVSLISVAAGEVILLKNVI